MGQCGNIFGRVVLMNQWGKILGRGSFGGSVWQHIWKGSFDESVG